MRPYQEVFEYTDEGKFLKKWESISQFRRFYFPKDIGKRPLFTKEIKGFEYEKLKKTIAFKKRPGRDNIRYFIKILKSKYCPSLKYKVLDEKEIEVYNLLDKKIATFSNFRIASTIMNISSSTIYHQLQSGHVKKATKSGLIFKYKN